MEDSSDNKIGAPKLELTNLVHEISMMNSNQDERIKISSKFFSYESTNYKTFDNVKKLICPMLDYLESSYQIKRYKRFGIRYINLINLPCTNKKNLFDWNCYYYYNQQALIKTSKQ